MIPFQSGITTVNVKPCCYGYHQKSEIEKLVSEMLTEPNIPKMAFHTHFDHYEFVVMPSGLTNASAIFQSTMNDLFREYLRKFVLVFFDDILIYSCTWEEHLQHIHTF